LAACFKDRSDLGGVEVAYDQSGIHDLDGEHGGPCRFEGGEPVMGGISPGCCSLVHGLKLVWHLGNVSLWAFGKLGFSFLRV
jgi:hypothetical protein